MNEIAQDPHAMRLSRFGLTCFLAVVIILPLIMLTFLWATLPKSSEQPLPVELRIELVKGNQALIVTNTSDQQLSNIGITLNDAFHYYGNDPLPGGQQVAIALGAFTRKNGIPFSLDSHQLMEVGVYAKLKDSSRGVKELKSDNLLEELQAGSTAASDPKSDPGS